MSDCIKCDEVKANKKRENYEAVLAKAKQSASDNNLKVLYIVQTKNFLTFKKPEDAGNYPVVETLLFD